MTQTIRFFLLLEAAGFGAASLVHSGVFIAGYEHAQARIAEGVIAVVLIIGLLFTFVNRSVTRPAGLAAQGFAPLGTLVGLFTITHMLVRKAGRWQIDGIQFSGPISDMPQR